MSTTLKERMAAAIVANGGEATTLEIHRYIEETFHCDAIVSSIHSALAEMEKDGEATRRYSEGSAVRQGRNVVHASLTAKGIGAYHG